MTAQRAISAVILNMALGFGFVANAQLSPYLGDPVKVNINVRVGNGGNGSNADCNTDSPPNDGHVGKTPSDFNDTINADLSTPDYLSVAYVSSYGGTGGTGGGGSTCYAGRGGGDGGSGGSITVNYGSSTSAPVSNVTASAIMAFSRGGQGGAGGGSGNTEGAGNGGNGGAGGAITLSNYGTIITTYQGGDVEALTLAGPYIVSCDNCITLGLGGVSQGGGGGVGGDEKNVVYGSAGDGSGGGVGGSVTLTNYGSISTMLGYAMAGLSVGGYGGDSGDNEGFVPSPNSSAGFGASGGMVSLSNTSTGSLQTNGVGQTAMLALSVGGGGGDAGQDSTLTQLGASGGPGAVGASITVLNFGSIQTLGEQSIGILALSVGGGGGTGGMAESGSLIGGSSSGGSGGGGGDGGDVSVENTGTICTGGGCDASAALISSGTAHAILALSVGGGGGSGGAAKNVSTGSSTALGGSGGDGGDGGDILVFNTGRLQTTESVSAGAFGHSVGGGGGNGGGAMAASAGQVNLSTAIGGSGGKGGVGGLVGINCGQSGSASSAACSSALSLTTNTSSSVTTFGEQSPGLFVQSVGGGGGTGGVAVALSVSTIMSSTMAIGGSGGSGGDGGDVYVNTAGSTIATQGSLSSGIEALSVGGGGGRGGITGYVPDDVSSGSVSTFSSGESIGGSGGDGGKGATVIAENMEGLIFTSGVRSPGILALSVGGGGGHGGLGVDGSVSLAFSATTSIGGQGGSGNTGGDVTVNNTSSGLPTSGMITTYGNDSSAIEAISVGGGGGRGGWSAGGAVSLGSTASITVGGNGGSGGNSGAVSVTNKGYLTVYGVGGTGLSAMSISGGGGSGGSSASGDAALGGDFSTTVGGNGGGGGKAGSVTVVNDGVITTGLNFYNDPSFTPMSTRGVLALSHGAGGGHGGVAVSGSLTGSGSISDTVGGGGGNGGTGGTVTVTNNGDVITIGALANGIIAMSTGGRGGVGGFAVAGSVSTGVPLNVAVGGNGGNGGNAGDVLVTNNGTITTVGYRAIGLSTQSIGGHGGMGGISIGATLSGSTTSSTVTLGGAGGKGGKGGTSQITHSSTGIVNTTGAYSTGLLAQSIGGDGGIGGMGLGASLSLISPSVTLGGSGGDGATGGTASITSYGSVTTSGYTSMGLHAQSIGGNGGTSGVTLDAGSADRAGTFNMTSGSQGGSGAHAGSAIANSFGTVSVSGLLATGVAVESIGGGGGRGGFALVINAADASNLSALGFNSSIGSSAGGGGDGSTADLVQSGTVTTTGLQSDALYAGSIGGGGGSSAFSGIDLTYGSKTFSSVAGGQDGSEGTGGAVSVSVAGLKTGKSTLQTEGLFSAGIFAQSVGGGGGSTSAAHQQTAAGGLLSGAMSLGSTGGSGGSGGSVDIDTGFGFSSAIQTKGYGSSAIIAQSIGGGGGQALSGLSSLNIDVDVQPGAVINAIIGSINGTPSGATNTVSSGTSSAGPSVSASLAGISGVSTTISYGSAGAMSLGGYATKTGSGGSITINSGSVIDTAGVMSDGIKAQSIGGGGGNSALFDGFSGSPFASSAMFLGGGSSGGGSGGDVTVNNNNDITTTGPLSLGILAQSLGGGGGDARLASMANTGLTSGLTVGLGAQSGAKGGDSGDVSVTNNDTIYTQGDGSDAIVAQAIGGGGGMGSLSGSGSVAPVFSNNGADTKGSSQSGSSASIAVNTSSSSSAAGIESDASTAGAAVTTHRGSTLAAVLGASGSSSAGQTVAVTNNGSLQTTNDGSNAAIAQSIGAGGGIVRHHLSNFDQMQTSLSLLLGAVESASGQSGTVSISSTNTSSVTTLGNASMGLLAQSIGGGGGLGLFTGSTVGTGGSASLSLALGGQGSSVGAGDSVSVTTGGAITTAGDQSQGIVAQSISNGGGVTKVVLEAAASGARLAQTSSYTLAGSLLAQANTNNGLAVAAVLGGGSTTAKAANDVTVTSASTISTSGIRSAGIVAQSVAGGGGIVDINTTALNSGDFAADVLLGGSSKSTGAEVNVTTTGSISTFGDLADGILAQSINSGGGSFGVSHLSALESGSGTLDFQLGSNGINDAITGEAVTVTAGASITTVGNGSTAITAQSLGAGGGVLAFKLSSTTASLTVDGRLGSEASSQGKAGAVTVTANAPLSSTGEFATLVLAQSIGGGGGRVMVQTMGNSPTGQLVLGAGNNGGDGNSVSVISNDTLTTTNNFSHGIVAQSIGAGGGLSDLNLGMDSGDNLDASGFDITTAFGATSSAQGVGGEVTVQVEGGPISTAGTNALGVVAQSIGGGGGLAVMNTTGMVSFGGQASSGPNGGTVSVSVGGHKILTTGNASPAVLAMSVGGGGGAALYRNAPTTGAAYEGNLSGDGGDVSITLFNSTVSTTGAGSDAVVAVSTGSGGGVIISNTGTTSVATGTGSGEVVSILIEGVSVVSTSGGATPVVIFGGTGQSKHPNIISTETGSSIVNNQYLNDPTKSLDTTNAAKNAWAIYAPDGYTNVTNYGSIIGNILLGTEGTGELFNYGTISATGLLVADDSLHNFGVLLPSGPGSTQGMTIDGSLKTYAGSEIHIDVNPAGTGPANDLVTVTGLARLAGEFVPQTQSLLPGGYSFLKAETLAYSGAIRDSHVFDWDVAIKDSGLTMSATGNFKPQGYGLEDNQGSLAGYLQRSWDGDSVGQALAFGYLHEYDRGDHAGFQAALDQMSGQVLNSQAIQMKTVFTTGLSDSLSCPAVTTAGYKLNQTNCTWIQLAGSIAEQSSTSSNLGYHVTSGGVRLGAQKQINADWSTGFALGYANNYLTATGLTSNGEFFNASASIKKKFERWSFGGSLGLAHGWFQNYRTPQLGGNGAAGSMQEQYKSDSTMTMVALRLRAAYEYERGDHYIKPYLDFDAIYSRQPGYTEQGAGVLALKANSNSQYNIGITPMIEYGTDVVTDGKRRIKAFVSAGVSFLPNNKVSTQMAFVNGLSSAGTYDVTTDGPTILGRFNVGIQAYESDSLEVRAQYGLQAGQGYWSQSVSANLLYRF
jgi:hypothetical protein